MKPSPGSHTFLPLGADRQKIFDHARKVSREGTVVLLHDHSARTPCQFQSLDGWQAIVDRVPADIWDDHILYVDGEEQE